MNLDICLQGGDSIKIIIDRKRMWKSETYFFKQGGGQWRVLEDIVLTL